MNFNVGDRVSLLRTGKAGTISGKLANDTYQVRLDGGLGHLPAPGHALALLDANSPAPAPAAPQQPATGRGNDRTDTGIQLAFDPIFNDDGDPEKYQLYLINGTRNKILYEIKVKTGDRQRSSKFGPLTAYEKLRLDLVPYAWLNERLTVELDVRAVVEGGTGPRHFHELKVRPKQFFSSFRDVPELRHEAHLFVVFPHLKATSVAEREAPASTLREITRAQLKSKPPQAQPAQRPPSLQDRGNFDPVLDLHLTALVDDPASVPKDKVLSLQMEHFDRFVDKALRLDVERIYIIHGLGNGILKTEIHQKLEHVPFVRKFSNDYHPKYGYGATEVIFDS
ncbi:Smr domain-containing protein [Neolewinella xylanilytica]|uniref:Smr domain-containing protein n=1 Tax=Neolewinella xylanilytica TaxID=1514080 RepID=A0A2S6I5H1_9BACT|nr:Smr/MutS family protein [Neolewinella xylanilytica]PPK86400.1 Smr domain-containing protein [Neolewinella xylanilytica]